MWCLSPYSNTKHSSQALASVRRCDSQKEVKISFGFWLTLERSFLNSLQPHHSPNLHTRMRKFRNIPFLKGKLHVEDSQCIKWRFWGCKHTPQVLWEKLCRVWKFYESGTLKFISIRTCSNMFYFLVSNSLGTSSWKIGRNGVLNVLSESH